jgi:hypothetical protein
MFKAMAPRGANKVQCQQSYQLLTRCPVSSVQYVWLTLQHRRG